LGLEKQLVLTVTNNRLVPVANGTGNMAGKAVYNIKEGADVLWEVQKGSSRYGVPSIFCARLKVLADQPITVLIAEGRDRASLEDQIGRYAVPEQTYRFLVSILCVQCLRLS
jgi:hypothetical protein